MDHSHVNTKISLQVNHIHKLHFFCPWLVSLCICLSVYLPHVARPHRVLFVVHPTLSYQETCMCKQYENLGLIDQNLLQIHIIDKFILEHGQKPSHVTSQAKSVSKCGNKGYLLIGYYKATYHVSNLSGSTGTSAVCSVWCIPPTGHFTHWCLRVRVCVCVGGRLLPPSASFQDQD